MSRLSTITGGRIASGILNNDQQMEERRKELEKPNLRTNLNQIPPPSENYKSLSRQAGDVALSGLGGLGNLLDLPGSVVRDLYTLKPGGLAPHNPFDQLLPWNWFSSNNRVTGEQILEGMGAYDSGPSEGRSTAKNIGRFAGGVGLEIAMDPLTYLTFGGGAIARGATAGAKAAKALKAAGMLGDASYIASKRARAATGKADAFVGRRQAYRELTPRDFIDDVVDVSDPAKVKKIQDMNRAKFRRGLGKKGVSDAEFEEILDTPLKEGFGKFKLPFTDAGSFEFGKGQRGLNLDKALDKAGDAVRYGKYSPVVPIAANFSKTTDQARGATAQRRLVEDKKRTDEFVALARERMYDNVRAITPHLNTGDDVVDMRRAEAMTQYMEGYNRKGTWKADSQGNLKRTGWDETRDEYWNRESARFSDIQDMKPYLDDMMDLIKDVESNKAGLGIDFGKLEEQFTDYLPRARQFNKRQVRSKGDVKTYDPTTEFGKGRRPYLKNIPGGTAILNEMSLDPRLAGVFNKKTVGSRGPSKSDVQEKFNYFLDTYGTKMRRIAREQGGDFDLSSFDGKEDLFKTITEHVRTSDVKAGSSMYDPNPVNAVLRNIESAYRASAEAKSMRKLIKANYDLADSTAKDNFDNKARAVFGTTDTVNKGINEFEAFARQLSEATGQSVESIYRRFDIQRPQGGGGQAASKAPPTNSPPPTPQPTKSSPTPQSPRPDDGAGPDLDSGGPGPDPGPGPDTDGGPGPDTSGGPGSGGAAAADPQEAAKKDVEEMFSKEKGDTPEPSTPAPKRTPNERLKAAREMRRQADAEDAEAARKAGAPDEVVKDIAQREDDAKAVEDIVREIEGTAAEGTSLKSAAQNLIDNHGWTVRDLSRIADDDDIISLSDMGVNKTQMTEIYGKGGMKNLDESVRDYVNSRFNKDIDDSAAATRAKLNHQQGNGYKDPVTGQEFTPEQIADREILLNKEANARDRYERMRLIQREQKRLAEANKQSRQADMFGSQEARAGQASYTEGELLNMSKKELLAVRDKYALTDPTFKIDRDATSADHIKAILDQQEKIKSGMADGAGKGAPVPVVPLVRRPTGKKGLGLAGFTKKANEKKPDTVSGTMGKVYSGQKTPLPIVGAPDVVQMGMPRMRLPITQRPEIVSMPQPPRRAGEDIIEEASRRAKDSSVRKFDEKMERLQKNGLITSADREVLTGIVSQMDYIGATRASAVDYKYYGELEGGDLLSAQRNPKAAGLSVTYKDLDTGLYEAGMSKIFLNEAISDREIGMPRSQVLMHELGHVFNYYVFSKAGTVGEKKAFRQFEQLVNDPKISKQLEAHFKKAYGSEALAKYLSSSDREKFAQLFAESAMRRKLPKEIKSVMDKAAAFLREMLLRLKEGNILSPSAQKRIDDIMDEIGHFEKQRYSPTSSIPGNPLSTWVNRSKEFSDEIDSIAAKYKGAMKYGDDLEQSLAQDTVRAAQQEMAERVAATSGMDIDDPETLIFAESAVRDVFNEAMQRKEVKAVKPSRKRKTRDDIREEIREFVFGPGQAKELNKSQMNAVEKALKRAVADLADDPTPELRARDMVVGMFTTLIKQGYYKVPKGKTAKAVASDKAREFGRRVAQVQGGNFAGGMDEATSRVFDEYGMRAPDELASELYNDYPDLIDMANDPELTVLQAIIDQKDAVKPTVKSPAARERAIEKGFMQDALGDATPEDMIRYSTDSADDIAKQAARAEVGEYGLEVGLPVPIKDGYGVRVKDMNFSGDLSRAGLEVGDVITSVRGTRVQNQEELGAELGKVSDELFTKGAADIEMTVLRDGEAIEISTSSLPEGASNIRPGMFDLAEDAPFQTVDGQRRGRIRGLYRDSARWMKYQGDIDAESIVIEAFDQADGTTFVHEIGHAMRDALAAADPQLEMDAQMLYNVKNGNWNTQITRNGETLSAEEWFAKDFEKWIETGRSPKGFRKYFEMARTYIKEMYHKHRGTPIADKLDPELQKFFDKVVGPELKPKTANLGDILKSTGYVTGKGTPFAAAAMRATIGPEDYNYAVGKVLEQRVADAGKTFRQGDEILDDMAAAVGQTEEETAKNMQALMDTLGIESLQVDEVDAFKYINVDQDLAGDITRLLEDVVSRGNNETMTGIEATAIDLYDMYNTAFKTGVTAINPGFHMRNLMSGAIQNIMNGVADPRFKGTRSYTQPYKDAHTIATGGVLKDANTIPGLENMTPEEATEQIRKWVFSYNVMDSPGMHRDAAASSQGSVTQAIPGAQKNQPGKRGKTLSWIGQRAEDSAGKGASKTKRAIESARAVGDLIETGHRTGGMIALLRQGVDPAEAARRINLLQVDYGNLSRFEKSYMRRIFPFYSFTRGMVDYVVDELATNPGGALAIQIKAANRGRDRDASTPDYVNQGLSLPLGVDPDGTRHFLTGLGLMHEAPVQLLDPIVAGNIQGSLFALGGMMNPVIKAPLEAAFNESLFQSSPQGGRSLDDQDPLIGRTASNIGNTLGLTDRTDPFKLPKMIELAASNSPAARYLSTTRQIFDPRKGGIAKGLGTMTGLRISTISPAAQDAVLRERAAEIMRGMGGKIFDRTYIPDYELERMSPDDRADAERWMALMNELAKRARDRKKQKDQSKESMSVN